MKYLKEYRNKEIVQLLLQLINRTVRRSWNIMEICGGQTHSIARYRIEDMLPPNINLLHGPGCPVCVTPVGIIDNILRISLFQNIIIATFGDMMRVPGTDNSLFEVKALGADVRIMYSPLEALSLAIENPDKEVIFFAVGFETTIPVYLTAIQEAKRRNINNFSLLTSFFTVPKAIEAVLSEKNSKVNGMLTAGHVCAIMGNEDYYYLASNYKCPMIVTGFEPVDLLYGIYKCVLQLENGKYFVENAYKRAVPEKGNLRMKQLINEMLEPVDQEWRGIGIINNSGLCLKENYKKYDAKTKFGLQEPITSIELPKCISGEIMKGNKHVSDCPYFEKECSPEMPLGAPMVSSEGVCAAYYNYR